MTKLKPLMKISRRFLIFSNICGIAALGVLPIILKTVPSACPYVLAEAAGKIIAAVLILTLGALAVDFVERRFDSIG